MITAVNRPAVWRTCYVAYPESARDRQVQHRSAHSARRRDLGQYRRRGRGAAAYRSPEARPPAPPGQLRGQPESRRHLGGGQGSVARTAMSLLLILTREAEEDVAD